MANACYNLFHITSEEGSGAALAFFNMWLDASHEARLAETGGHEPVLSFQALRPLMGVVDANDRQEVEEASMTYWGSPGEPEGLEVYETSPDLCRFLVTTDWTPPASFVVTMSHQFRDVCIRMTYVEPAVGMAGVVEGGRHDHLDYRNVIESIGLDFAVESDPAENEDFDEIPVTV